MWEAGMCDGLNDCPACQACSLWGPNAPGNQRLAPLARPAAGRPPKCRDEVSAWLAQRREGHAPLGHMR